MLFSAGVDLGDGWGSFPVSSLRLSVSPSLSSGLVGLFSTASPTKLIANESLITGAELKASEELSAPEAPLHESKQPTAGPKSTLTNNHCRLWRLPRTATFLVRIIQIRTLRGVSTQKSSLYNHGCGPPHLRVAAASWRPQTRRRLEARAGCGGRRRRRGGCAPETGEGIFTCNTNTFLVARIYIDPSVHKAACHCATQGAA